MTQPCKRLLIALVCLVLSGAVLACQPETAETRAWIDAPSDGATVPVGAPVTIVSHAYARDGVAEVVLLVNGEPYRRNPPAQPGAPFSKATHEWTPQEGTYILRARVYAKSGEARDSAPISIRAIGKGTTITPTRVPTLTATPTRDRVTPVPPAGALDLAIVSVEAIVAGDKGGVPFCNTRVTYRNAGTVAVPRNFAVQFSFNGVPTFTNTVAGGLPPGATDTITFVYQFEGAPYIGINLDSGNVIAESDETNNAFAEARQCGGTPVPTRTATATPTRTPTIPPQPQGCVGTPSIAFFTAAPATINAGQAATLSWGAVTNADSVSIEPGIGGVAAPGTLSVSPRTTTTYTLLARCGNNTLTRQATINVTSAPPIISVTPTRTRTPTTPPDNTAPAAPSPQVPANGLAVACRTTQTLAWLPVGDASGIAGYYVKLERQVRAGEWQSAAGYGPVSDKQVTANVQCGGIYRWAVRARDNAGNYSDWSSWSQFGVNLN